MTPRPSQIEDAVFVERPDGPLLIRLYYPEHRDLSPALLEVHAGSWVSNDRTHSSSLAHDLARRGILVASVDYRMAPAHQYPTPISDINAAVRWLKSKTKELRIDPTRIGGLGISSGGHQLLLSALRPQFAEYVDPGEGLADYDSVLDRIILCSPVLDPHTRYLMANRQGMQEISRAHQSYWPDEDAMKEGSPQRIIDEKEATHLPRILLLHGREDANVPIEMAQRFVDSYRKAGGLIAFQEYEETSHAFLLDRQTPAYPHALALLDSFARNFP